MTGRPISLAAIRPSRTAVFAALVAAAAALSASLGIGFISAVNPRLTLGLTLVALAMATVYFVVRAVGAADAAERTFLCNVFLFAVAVRFSVALLTYVTLPYGFFAPDESGYTDKGAELAVTGLTSLGDLTRFQGWLYFNALVAHFFDNEAEVLLRLINCVVGAIVPVLCYRLASEMANPAAGRRAAWLTAVFPSLVLWSSLNLKDAEMHVFILATLLIGLQLQRGLSVRHLLLLGLVLLMTATLRPYLVLALMGSVVVAQLVGNRSSLGRLATLLIVAGALLVPLALWLPGFGDLYGKMASLDNVSVIRAGFGGGAQSAYMANPNVQTPLDILRFVPVALAFFLLGPFPSLSGSTLQVLTAPEMILYYLLIPFMLLGAHRALKRRPSAALPVLVFTAMIAVSYSLALANFGTAYRFRAQLLLILLSLAGIGMFPLEAAARGSRSHALPPPAPVAEIR